MAPEDDGLAEVRGWIADADRIAVLTGAGISAESGIPTFRDAQSGLWAKFDPAQLASPEGFAADPGLVWGWYASRRDGVRQAQPNAAHRALADWAAARPGRMTVITQNVDDLHQRAGNTGTIRLHGNILEDRWLGTCAHRARGGNTCDTSWAEAGHPPRCAECGNAVRPGVVWFGENLPLGALNAAEKAAERCAVMLVVGTSGAVWPAAGLAARARRSGATVIIVNPAASEIDAQAHCVLRGTAAQTLPLLLA